MRLPIKKLTFPISIYLIDILLTAIICISASFVFVMLNWDDVAFKLIINTTATALSASVIMFALIRKKKLSIDVSLNVSWSKVIGILILGILVHELTYILFWGVKSSSNALTLDGYTIINRILPILIIGPIFEELFFRNTIQKILSKDFNVYFSIVLASCIFSLGHMFIYSFSLKHFVYFIITGMVYGCCYHYSRNVLVAIFLHSISNFLAIVLH